MSIQRLLTADETAIERDRFAMGEKNDCAVKAIALATGISYPQVHATLKAAGRRNRCGTYLWQTEKTVKNLGFDMIRIPLSRGCTTKTVGRFLTNGNFLVRISRHILAVRNGQVLDWSATAMKRVKEIFRIVPTGLPIAPSVPVVAKPVAPVVVKPVAPKANIDFSVLRSLLVNGATVDLIISNFGCTSNQARSAIDALRRRGANIQNIARNTFKLYV